MSGIETADMRPHTLDRANSLLISSPEKSPPSLRFLLDQPSVLQEHSIMPTKSAALLYDLNRARFAGPETKKQQYSPELISLNTFRN
jgi:hypothetical protein